MYFHSTFFFLVEVGGPWVHMKIHFTRKETSPSSLALESNIWIFSAADIFLFSLVVKLWQLDFYLEGTSPN